MKTILFYEQLADLTKGSYAALQKNVRLFMVPGMQHCGGGPGPNVFSLLTALDAWVDQGLAPDQILATKYTNDRRTEPVVRRMPLCKFPEQAKYSGSGDVNDAANWSCSAEPVAARDRPQRNRRRPARGTPPVTAATVACCKGPAADPIAREALATRLNARSRSPSSISRLPWP